MPVASRYLINAPSLRSNNVGTAAQYLKHTMQDPHTGQFAKGNPGRPKGTKNTRTVQWEELGRNIMDANAQRFNELLDSLWDSPELADRIRAAELFLKLAEYFKPKLQRTQPSKEGRTPLVPPLIVVDGKAEVPENWPFTVIKLHPFKEEGSATSLRKDEPPY